MRCIFEHLKLFLVAIALCFYGSLSAEKLPEVEKATITQQNVRLNGTVVDANGPLVGASILVKGTNNGATTDVNGHFILSGLKNGVVLQVSYLGYVTQEITFNGQSDLEILLLEDSQTLGEVVVTALGIKREAKALGYAISTIDSKDLVKVGTPNFGTALYGKAAGVRIQAAPGGNTSAVSMTVRGLSSITGNTQPLLIVDGVPVRNGNANNGEDESKTSRGWDNDHVQGNGLIDINPEDIESISILKGAAATALYGSEAANGVILVTSKKGTKSSGLRVNFNATLSANMVAYMPKVQTTYGPGNETLSMGAYELNSGGFVERTYNGKTYKSIYNGSTRNFGPKYDGSDVLYWDGSVRKYNSLTDSPWSELFRTGFNQVYNVSITHGGEKSNTRFSYTYVDDTPNQINSSYSKHNFNLAGSLNISNNLSVDYTANYIRQNIDNRPLHINWMLTSFEGIAGSFDDMLTLREKTRTSLGYRNVVTGGDLTLTPDESLAFSIPYFRAMENYVWPILADKQLEFNSRFISSVAPQWKIIDGLTLRGRLSTDLTTEHIERKRSTVKPILLYPSDPGGEYDIQTKSYEIYYGDVMLMLNKNITEQFGIMANVGFQGRNESLYGTRLRTNGGLSTENWFHINATMKAPAYWEDKTEFLKTAYFGTLSLSYLQSLFVEATIRQEKTSTLSPGNNSFLYPSVNASWVFMDMTNSPTWYDYGKIRASYGVVGNAPEVYAANVAFDQNQNAGYIYNKVPSNYGNESIKPETKYEYEFGLESKFFRNRLGFEISYYNNRVVDQILPITLPQSAGATSILLNIGELKNYGVEFTLNATPLQTRDFRWDVRFNYAFNRNEVVKLKDDADHMRHDGIDEGGGQVQLWSVVGRPMGDIYAYIPMTDGKGNTVIGSDGLPVMDETERVRVGNVLPDAVGGFGTSLKYKDFVLDAMFDYRIGGKIMNWGYQYSMARGTNPESLWGRDPENGGQSYYFKDNKPGIENIVPSSTPGPNGEKLLYDGIILSGVTEDGKTNTQMIPVSRYYHYMYNWGSGCDYSKSIFDNTYLKVRELSLYYQVPAKLISKFGCRNMSVGVFGRNLFYLYKSMPMFDAEATDGTTWVKQSYINGATATTRTIGFSLRAGF